MDDVDVGPMDGDEEEEKHGVNSSGGGQKPGLGSGLEDHDVIVISRREIVATLLAAASIATFLLAVQRSNAIRRWSLAAFRGVLEVKMEKNGRGRRESRDDGRRQLLLWETC